MDGMGDSEGSGLNGGGESEVEDGMPHEQAGEERKKKQWGPPRSIDPMKSSRMTYAKVGAAM